MRVYFVLEILLDTISGFVGKFSLRGLVHSLKDRLIRVISGVATVNSYSMFLRVSQYRAGAPCIESGV